MTEERKREFRKRTKQYAIDIILAYKELDKSTEETKIVGRQMLRSGTSVAANYREASRARSVADFISKIQICAQEADETLLWVELLQEACHQKYQRLTNIADETNELIAIFVTMAKNAKRTK